MDQELKDRFVGTLLGGCIGDVLGSTNENLSFSQIRKERRIVTKFSSNMYTDDTELTLILANYLLNHFNPSGKETIINELHKMYRSIVSTSARGYSQKTRTLLTNWHECMSSFDSDTNGSVMRIAPLALVRCVSDTALYRLVKQAVYCTHGDSKDSLDTSFLHVKLIKALLFKKCKDPNILYLYALEIVKKLQNSTLYPLLVAIHPNNKKTIFNGNSFGDVDVTESIFGFEMMQIKAVDCYVCVLTCFLYNFYKPVNALLMAANMGGDTDTIAKCVGDLVGSLYGTSWIPDTWKSPEGAKMCVALGEGLYERFRTNT